MNLKKNLLRFKFSRLPCTIRYVNNLLFIRLNRIEDNQMQSIRKSDKKHTFANQCVCPSICHYLGLNRQMWLHFYLYNKDRKKSFQHDNSILLPFKGQFYHSILLPFVLWKMCWISILWSHFLGGKMLLWMITKTKSSALLDIPTNNLNVPKNKIYHHTINVYTFEIFNFQYDTLVNL